MACLDNTSKSPSTQISTDTEDASKPNRPVQRMLFCLFNKIDDRGASPYKAEKIRSQADVRTHFRRTHLLPSLTRGVLPVALGMFLGGTQIEAGGSVPYLEAEPPRTLRDLEMLIETTLRIREHSPISTQTYALVMYLFIFAVSILHHSRRHDDYQNPIAAASLLVGITAGTLLNGDDFLSSAARWAPINLAVGLALSAFGHHLARSIAQAGQSVVVDGSRVHRCEGKETVKG
ncbi:hypothetical protein QBC35DRAFT_495331 [Podospora australis]|uniref:Uncharacterized protein n=1 Tax=Podospora australis TaxID=1536484 RepID=A0AAN6WYH6_9PEZI|nr:hypothetical protein QBC35DRAFT_495331 [Podospora australis]